MTKLSERLVHGITSQLSHVVRNGDELAAYPGCVNLSFSYVEGESLLMALKDVALSSGRYDKSRQGGLYQALFEFTEPLAHHFITPIPEIVDFTEGEKPEYPEKNPRSTGQIN